MKMKIKTQLKNIASYSKGEQINGDDLIENGTYDYLNGGIAPSGKWNSYNTPANTVTISEGGNSCGYVNFMNKPFWCGAHCYYLFDTISNAKYLYYALKSQQDRLMKIRSGACIYCRRGGGAGITSVSSSDDSVVLSSMYSAKSWPCPSRSSYVL